MSQNKGPVAYRPEPPEQRTRKPRPSRITVPERCHPLAKLLFSEMRRQRKTYSDLEWESGVLRGTTKEWRKSKNPGLITIEATLGAVGWTLVPVPSADTLPPELRSDLAALAAKHAADLPALEFTAAFITTAASRRPRANLAQLKAA